MTPVVLVTFAGRQKRMEILAQYVRKAMQDGIIDEWHVWDFTRTAEDSQWLRREFGPARYMASKAPYESAGKVTPQSSFRTTAKIERDLHLAIMPNDDADHCFEIVIGGWTNSHCALRKLGRDVLNDQRADEGTIWRVSTPGVLSPSLANQVVFNIDAAGVPSLRVNDIEVGKWPELNLGSGASVMIRGGYGADLEICDVAAPVRRYVGNPNEKTPYWQAYDYYARRLNDFSSAIFLKCDDDIVYLDVEKLDGFIQFRRANPNYFIVSANVVNNGVCAFWQQSAGSLPEHLGYFERPPRGLEGSLWQSAERATELHRFFLESGGKPLPLPHEVIEWNERHSINFISWLGRDLLHMALPKCDDEYVLSVDLPSFLNRPSAIYSDFMVSHLSFFSQEQGLDLDHLIQGYAALMQDKLGL